MGVVLNQKKKIIKGMSHGIGLDLVYVSIRISVMFKTHLVVLHQGEGQYYSMTLVYNRADSKIGTYKTVIPSDICNNYIGFW